MSEHHDPQLHPLKIPGLEQSLSLYVHDASDLHVSKTIREDHIWEPYETALILEHLKAGQSFVDVGANIGYYSVIASALVGKTGQVFAFEPEPKNFVLLEKNCLLNGFEHVVLKQAALANQQGQGFLYLNEKNLGDHQIYNADDDRDSCRIELLNGSEVLCDYRQRVDFIKIDTQGAEFKVVSGLEKIIRASLPDVTMIVEFWPFGLRKAGDSGDALLDLLVSFDLEFKIIDHLRHVLIDCTEKDLRDWIDEMDNNPKNEGFVNILMR